MKVERVEPAEALHTDRHTMLEVVVQDDGMDLDRFEYQSKDEGLDEELISSPLARSYLRLFRENKEPWKKILLTGEPGTGKTYFAHELLREAERRGLKVYAIPASMFVGEFVGDTIRVVNAVKKGLSKDCMLFVDDCDLLLHTRNDMKSYGALLESGGCIPQLHRRVRRSHGGGIERPGDRPGHREPHVRHPLRPAQAEPAAAVHEPVRSRCHDAGSDIVDGKARLIP